MKKIIIVFYCIIFVFPISFAQIKLYEIKSPEAAAFERIAEVPVGAYTGTLNFSIPIYSIKCGDLILPISLDYMGSAIRVDQEATWVGLNWMLNAGGAVITKLAPANAQWGSLSADWDKLKTLSCATPTVGGNGFVVQYKVNGMHDVMPPQYGHNWFSQGITSAYINNDLSNSFYHAVLDGFRGEANTYSASFFNQSLQFAYDFSNDSFFITGNKKNYRITGAKWGNIRITDGMGNIYVFGKSETTQPASNADERKPYTVTNYLTRVISPKGDTVKIEYSNYGYTYPLRQVTASITDGYPAESNRIARTLSEYAAIDNQYVSCISCRDIVIRFDVGPRIDLKGDGARKLDQIRILRKSDDGSEHLIKRYVFSYGYFTDNGIGGNMLKDYYCIHSNLTDQYNYLHGTSNTYMGNRLRLSSLQEVFPDGNRKPAYIFSYTTNTMPGKQSAAQDYWGFYNGKANTYGGFATIMPQGWQGTDDGVYMFTKSTREPMGDRRSDASYAEAGMLRSVTYPSGGTATIQYEANQFTNFQYLDAATYNMDKPLKNINLYSSEMEFMLPDFQRGHRTDTFHIIRPTRVQLIVQFRKQNEFKTWQELLSHYVLMQKMAYGHYNTYTYEYPQETQVIRPLPADTLNTTFATVTIDKYLTPGKYALTIAPFTQEEWSASYHPSPNMIQLSLSARSDFVSMGAGVRVKSVTMNSGNGTYTTEYDYTMENGEPSGKLMAPVRLVRNKDLVNQGTTGQLYNNGGRSETYIPPAPTQFKSYKQLTSYNQASAANTLVGYSRVTAIRTDSSNGALGKTTTTYINNIWGTGPMYEFLPRTENPCNGQILSEEQYSASNKLLRKTENRYSSLGFEARYLSVTMENIYNGPTGPIVSLVNPYAAALTTGCVNIAMIPSTQFWYALSSTSTMDFQGGDTVTVTNQYTYNPNNMAVSRASRSTSVTGETETTFYTYPENYAGTPFADTLISAGITEVPIETVEVLQDSTGVKHIRNSTLLKYDKSGNATEKYHIPTREMISMPSFQPSNTGTFIPNDSYQLTAAASYAANGNPREIIENDTYHTVYVWGYHNNYPVAVIRNATRQQVLQALGKDEDELRRMEDAEYMDIEALRNQLLTIPKALVTTYTYIPYLGMASCTEPNGKVSTYGYDAMGRLTGISNHDDVLTNEILYNFKRR